MSKFERGDTIVEVLFAIAVIGFVLGASYASASRSVRLGRDAQEHTQALKLAETQVERLKYLATNIDPNNPSAATDVFDDDPATIDFCIDDTLTKQLIPNTNCESVADSPFDQHIQYDEANSLFLVSITWDRIVSGPKGNVQIAYKLHNGTN